MYDDLKEALQEAAAAATPHLLAAGRELLAAGSAFVDALNGEARPGPQVVEVDVAAD